MKRQHASVQSKPSKQIKTEVLSDDETTVNENYIPQVREQTNASSVKVEKADDTPERVISIIQNQRGTLAQLTDILQLKPDLNVYIDGGTALHHCISESKLFIKPYLSSVYILFFRSRNVVVSETCCIRRGSE